MNKIVVKENTVRFKCPGCSFNHVLNVDAHNRPAWGFNGNAESPTITPSIRAMSGHYVGGRTSAEECLWCGPKREDDDCRDLCYVCHSFVTDGKIQFLSDSTHHLSGQTVDLPDVQPDEVIDE